jgi:hypothetical protein
LRLPTAAIWYFVAARTRPPQAVIGLQHERPTISNIRSSRGVITMGDHQDRPVLALLLETLVVTALIGTFFVYGYPNTGAGTAAVPGGVAGLNVSE